MFGGLGPKTLYFDIWAENMFLGEYRLKNDCLIGIRGLFGIILITGCSTIVLGLLLQCTIKQEYHLNY